MPRDKVASLAPLAGGSKKIKAEKRDRKKKMKMAVSGKSVFNLKKIIIRKSSK